MPHFTYKSGFQKEHLCQGDVLEAGEELKLILQDYHPYFNQDRYKYFIVLTQTCDLVLYGEKCKSKYITIAVVRPLKDFIYRETEKLTRRKGELILLDEKHQKDVRQLLERVLNNNEPEHFYLSEDPEQSFVEPMVADLKVTITLKSNEHYIQCLNAKVLELTDEFKAKLGWLIGQMYSRVGTPDWKSEKRDDEFNERIKVIMKDSFIIGNKQKLAHLIDFIEKGEIDQADPDSIKDAMDNYHPESNYTKLISTIENICDSNAHLFSSKENLERFKRHIESSSKIQGYVKKE